MQRRRTGPERDGILRALTAVRGADARGGGGVLQAPDALANAGRGQHLAVPGLYWSTSRCPCKAVVSHGENR